MSDKLNKAEDLLAEARQTLVERGKLHDKAGVEERSLGAVAQMMTALKGKEYTAEDIGLVQICVKLVRSQQGNYHHDNFVDLAGYAALTGEEAHRRYLDQESKKTRMVGRGSCQNLATSVPSFSQGRMPAVPPPPNFDYGNQEDREESAQFIQYPEGLEKIESYANVESKVIKSQKDGEVSVQLRSIVDNDVTASISEAYKHLMNNLPHWSTSVLKDATIGSELASPSLRLYTITVPQEVMLDPESGKAFVMAANMLGDYLNKLAIIAQQSKPPTTTGVDRARESLVATLTQEKDDTSKVFMEFLKPAEFSELGIAFEVPKSHPAFAEGYYIAENILSTLQQESPLGAEVTDSRLKVNIVDSGHDKYMRVEAHFTDAMFRFVYTEGLNVALRDTVHYLRDYLTPLDFKRGFVGKK